MHSGSATKKTTTDAATSLQNDLPVGAVGGMDGLVSITLLVSSLVPLRLYRHVLDRSSPGGRVVGTLRVPRLRHTECADYFPFGVDRFRWRLSVGAGRPAGVARGPPPSGAGTGTCPGRRRRPRRFRSCRPRRAA